jgi:hypothetical protein
MVKINEIIHYKDARNQGIFKEHTIREEKKQFVEEYDPKVCKIVKRNTTIYKTKLCFNNFYYDNTSSILFKNKVFSFEYFEVGYEKVNEMLNKYENLYEVITKGMNRKYFIDLDFKDGTKVSLNEMTNLCRAFILFLNSFYNAHYDINYSILASLNEGEKYKAHEKEYKSIHIIFNIYTTDNLQMKEVFYNFKNTKELFTEYIDFAPYSNMRLMRVVKQRKELQHRTDKLRQIGGTNEYDLNSIITHITNKDIFFEIELKKERKQGEIITTNYNLNYNIQQLDKFKNYLSKLTATELSKTKWFNNLNILIHILRLQKIEWNDILTHELTQMFLKKSEICPYNTAEAIKRNIEIIKLICDKKELKRNPKNKTFFNDLTEEEAEFIYEKLNKQPQDILTITDQTINNKLYLLIQEGNPNNEDFNPLQKINYYDTKNYILLINCKIQNTTNGTNTKKLITTEEQHNFYLNQILNLPSYSFNNNKHISFKDWNETDTNTNENTYNEAPVGSGKSSGRMFKDIGAILTENNTDENGGHAQFSYSDNTDENDPHGPFSYNNNNCILMPCDTQSLSRTHLTNMRRLFLELKLDNSGLKHYKDFDKDAHSFSNENIRLLICCYDSIWKFKNIPFTHIIIDEYINVRKRFTQVSKDNIEEQNECMIVFFTLLQNAKAVKCYDADLPSRDLKLLERYSKKKFNYYKLNEYIQANNKVVFTNKKRMTDMILKDINNNRNLTISTTTRVKAEELYSLLIQTKQDLKICIIEGNGKAKDHTLTKWSEKLKTELISNTKLWVDYNIVIWTPTIMTGLSEESNKYFYKHYGFCGLETTDMTQTAQMLFRVRNTETQTIVICDINDRANFFYNYMKTEEEVEKEIEKKNYGLNSYICNKNIETNNDNELLHGSIYQKYAKLYEIEEKRREQFYYDLFYTLRKWGCNNLKCEFYYFSSEEEFIFKQIQKVVYDDINMIKINDFEEFIALEGNINNLEEINEREITPYKLKMLGIMKYGYSQLLFNTLNHTELFNYILFNIYNSNSEYLTYKRLQKLTYYSVKDCIYKLIELIFKDMTDIKTIYLKQRKTNDTDNLINWLFCSVVIFKIGSLLQQYEPNEKLLIEGHSKEQEELNYNDFMHNIITEQSSSFILKDITDLIECLKPIKPLYDLLISNEAIFINKEEPKARGNITNILTYAFNYFKIQSNISFIEKTLSIELTRQGIPYRIEKECFLLEKGNHDLNTNDYDDMTNWVENKTKYITGYNREIPLNFLPKIRAYNHYSESSINKRLYNYFFIYCNEANNKTLCEMLYAINTEKIKNVKNIKLENPLYIKEVEKQDYNPIYIEAVDIEGEIFKQTAIKNYKVSNLGRVKHNNKFVEILRLTTPICNNRKEESFNRISKTKMEILKVEINYVYINEYVYFVDRLVAESFLEHYRADYYIKHINNCYNNDNSSNLIMVEKWEKSVYVDLLKAKKQTRKNENKVLRAEKAKEKIKCENCNKEISKSNKSTHLKKCKSK